MKTTLLLFSLIISAIPYCQDSSLVAYAPSNTLISDGYVPYVVGSTFIPGYDLEIRTCTVDETITLSNGKRIAGLSFIIFEKKEYIGGNLIFNGDTTKITDILIEPLDSGANFIVKGKDFSMNFNLSDGCILMLEDSFTVFNTEGIGVWSIIKK